MVAIKPLVEALPRGSLIMLFAGGLAYSLGTVFYLWKRLPYHHAVWHLFVLAGSICHSSPCWAALPSRINAVESRATSGEQQVDSTRFVCELLTQNLV